MLYLNSDFSEFFAGRDPYDVLGSIEGKIYRHKEGRKTFQFQLNESSYFVKLHSGIGWREALKNLLQLRVPVFGARNEWRAIQKLHDIGVDTIQQVAYGERGWNPVNKQSFIITEELTGTVSLEDYCRNWGRSAPHFTHKLRLLQKLAQISRAIHTNGICHRDYYLCHFHIQAGADLTAPFELPLIDLHRAICQSHLRARWKIKDLGGLYYSAMTIGLTRRDLFRFIRIYDNTPLRQSLAERKQFWAKVERRAQAIMDKEGPAFE